jgi:glycosyltransferase involved in cell wall biosynthesis
MNDAPTGAQPVTAYLVSRFPKVTETFIVRELLELERQGVPVELFAVVHEREPVTQPEMAPLAERAHYGWPPGRDLLLSQLFWLRRAPRRYARVWARALLGNIRSPRFLVRALFVVPVGAHFARQMQRLGIRHVHAHWVTHPALAALVIKQLTGIPYSIRPHAKDLYVDQTMLGEKISEAEFVATISDYNRRFLAQRYGESAAAKTVVIRYGVDTELFHRGDRLQRGADTEFHVVCIASLQEYKGHPYLIAACAELVRRGVPLQCSLVGEGEERRALESMIHSLGLEDRVHLLGRQTSSSVRELLDAADVMVLPSIVARDGTMEGLPNAIIEALAMEVPVVTTAISGIGELVEDGRNGLLVPERDTDALVEAIARLYSAPEERRAMGRAGRESVVEAHDLQRNVATLRHILADADRPEAVR